MASIYRISDKIDEIVHENSLIVHVGLGWRTYYPDGDKEKKKSAQAQAQMIQKFFENSGKLKTFLVQVASLEQEAMWSEMAGELLEALYIEE
jgi:hypothetical protein